MPPHSVRARIWHALEAAHAVPRITTDRSIGDYQSDEMVRMAVERGLTVVGEAVGLSRACPKFF